MSDILCNFSITKFYYNKHHTFVLNTLWIYLYMLALGFNSTYQSHWFYPVIEGSCCSSDFANVRGNILFANSFSFDCYDDFNIDKFIEMRLQFCIWSWWEDYCFNKELFMIKHTVQSPIKTTSVKKPLPY